MSAAVFTLQQVEVRYNGRGVLSIDDLQVFEHETLVVLGPNGAGKSTLLRLLNFLEPPTRGRILYRGAPLSYPVPLGLRRRVTTLFQRPVLLSRSVRANIAYGLELRGGASPPAVERWLAHLDLIGLAGAHARTLSGGEAQRVALARALAVEPEVLLLDEPTANLDPTNQRLVEGMIQDLRAARTTTQVLVTHNVFQARRLADRVAMLLGGRLIEVAPADSFFEHPRDDRVAAFLRGEPVG